MESLVTTQWLADGLGADGLAVADASYFLPEHGRDARADYLAAHIPGAVFLDLATLRDENDPRPNMMPPADVFALRMQALGLGHGDRIVLYDDTPLRPAARAWFMLRAFGAKHVAILDGGFAKWRAEGRPVEAGPEQTREAQFTPTPQTATIVDLPFMRANLESSALAVADARSAERFAGGPPDAHGVPGGHIPGAANLPYPRLFNPDGTWKRGAALRAEFDAAGIDPARPFVATCGSGVTANVLLFGAHLLGAEGSRLYDGSWAEWGADPDTPKAAT